MIKNRKTNKRNQRKGGTKGILRKTDASNKTKKRVQWHSTVVSPKPKLGRTRSRTKAQSQNK